MRFFQVLSDKIQDSIDQKMMNKAFLEAQKSKDPSTQVGCIISTPLGLVKAQGHNRFPNDVDPATMSWERPIKYELIIHAEMVALSKISSDALNLKELTLFTTQAPCANCLKHIIDKGIKRVVFSKSCTVKKMSDVNKEALLRLLKGSDIQVVSTIGVDLYRELSLVSF